MNGEQGGGVEGAGVKAGSDRPEDPLILPAIDAAVRIVLATHAWRLTHLRGYEESLGTLVGKAARAIVAEIRKPTPSPPPPDPDRRVTWSERVQIVRDIWRGR